MNSCRQINGFALKLSPISTSVISIRTLSVVCLRGDGRFSRRCCVFPDDTSFSHFIFMFSYLCYFLSPSSGEVYPPFFVVHVASCLPLYVTICLSADVFVPSWLSSSSLTPPFVTVTLRIYIIRPWKICVCDGVSILRRLPVATWDTPISRWASCPDGSLPLSLCLFQPFHLTSTPHPTHSDEYTCLVVPISRKPSGAVD